MRVDFHVHPVSPRHARPSGQGSGDATGDVLETVRANIERSGEIPSEVLEALSGYMERFDVDAAVLSVPSLLPSDPRAASNATRALNEAVARVIRAEPTRFGGVATLPLPDLDRALAELQYGLDSLKLDGVMLLTQYDGVYLGHHAWDPLFAELDRRGAFLHIHPAAPPYRPPLSDRYPVGAYEATFETVRVVTNLVYTGTLGRYPNIKVKVDHLGGAIPFLAHRIAYHVPRVIQDPTPEDFFAALRRLYYDTAQANYAPMYEQMRHITEPDHIVFGTDWPLHDLELQPGATQLAPGLAGLPADERAGIDSTNARHLVPRLAEAAEGVETAEQSP